MSPKNEAGLWTSVGNRKEEEISSGVTLESTLYPNASVSVSAEGATSEDTGE